MTETIQDYLVSLGFDVDAKTYSKFNAAMGHADDLVEKFGLQSISSFAKAGVSVAAFVASATVGMAKFMKGLADADMEVQKFARSMWMSVDNARALKTTLDVMGESLEDIALNPELRKQFQELRTQAFQMEAPAEYKEQMRMIRSIMFEITRFKLEVKYASQWVGYYLYKYLEKPLANIKKQLKGLNIDLVKSMPIWTKYIAQGLAMIARLFMTAIRVVVDLFNVINDLPPALKLAGAALIGFLALFSLSPVGLFMLAIIALLVIIDDLYTALDGGESIFSWNQWISDLGDTVDIVAEKIRNFTDGIKQMIKDVKALMDFFNKGEIKQETVIDFFSRALKAYRDWNLKNGTQNGMGGGGGGGGGISYDNTNPLYGSSKQIVQNITYDYKVEPTFNQYGSDPKAVAGSSMSYLDKLLFRNLKGVVG